MVSYELFLFSSKMKSFFVALVILGCALSCAFAAGCYYPHKGNGGVMDENDEYIPGKWQIELKIFFKPF